MKIKKVITTTIDTETLKETVESSSWVKEGEEQPVEYWNEEMSDVVKCEAGFTGTPINISVAAHTYKASTQTAANDLAKADLEIKRAEAKGNLVCVKDPVDPVVFKNTEQTATCPIGTTGSPVTTPAGIFEAPTQDEADRMALQDARNKLVCVIVQNGELKYRYFSDVRSYTAKAPAGYECEDKTYGYPDDAFISHISKEDANSHAEFSCKKMAKGLVYRYMTQTNPTIQDGLNGSWGIGSIQKGSKDFIADFMRGKLNVGDEVMVDTGKLYGQYAGGDGWPHQRFETKKEMEAAVIGDNDYVGCVEDQGTYQYDKTHHTYVPFRDMLPEYLGKINPYGLGTKVKSITPLTGTKVKITLDKAAAETETNVMICFDIRSALQSKTGNVVLPAGKFYSSWQYEPNRTTFLSIKGAGMNETFLQSPKGFTTMSLQIPGTWDNSRPDNKAVVSDLCVIGNHGANGFRFKEDIRFKDEADPDLKGLAWISGRIEKPSIYTQGIAMGSWYGTVQRCRTIDCIGYGIQSLVKGFTIDSNEIIFTEEEREYMGWEGIHVQGASEDAQGKVTNNVFVAHKLTHAFQAYQTQNVLFKNNNFTNGLMALNGTSEVLMEDYLSNVSSNAQPGSPWYVIGGPLSFRHIEVNGLMDPSKGNIFRRVVMNNSPFPPNEHFNYVSGLHGLFGGQYTPLVQVFDSHHVCGDGTDYYTPCNFHLDANKSLVKNCKSYNEVGPEFKKYTGAPGEEQRLYLWLSSIGLDYPKPKLSDFPNATEQEKIDIQKYIDEWEGGVIEDCEVNPDGGTIRTVKGAKIKNCKGPIIVEEGDYNG